MPLVPQQDIVSVQAGGFTSAAQLVPKLKQALEAYPPCRIISISTLKDNGALVMTAVIETI